MKKIFWCHSHFLNWTGGSNYILQVVKRLSKKYDIVVVGSVFSKEATEKFSEDGIKTVSVGSRSTNSFKYWLNLRNELKKESKKLKKIVKDNDVIITSMFPMNYIVMNFRNPKLQCLWEPYSLFHDRKYIQGFGFFKSIPLYLLGFFYKEFDIKGTRSTDSIITLSKYNKNWIKRVYGRDDAIVGYEGVDTSFFKPTENAKLHDTYKGKKIIFHSTDFTAVKGTKYLIRSLPEIFKKFPDSVVLVSNTIDDENSKKRYLKFAEKNGFQQKIKFLGRLDYELLPMYYSMARVVVQPSVRQNMSLPVKEAMSCETPIVTLKEGHEQTPDGIAGYLVDTENPSEIASAVIKILSSYKNAKKMGKEGRKIILKKFTWDKVARVYERSIDKLLK